MTQSFSVEAYDLDNERLRLRPWRPNDLLDFYEYASVPGVGELAGWPPHTSLDQTQKILEQFIKGLSQNTVKCDETAPFSWVKREMLSCKCFRNTPSRKVMVCKVIKPGEFGEKGKRK